MKYSEINYSQHKTDNYISHTSSSNFSSIVSVIIIGVIFYLSAYITVSNLPPTSIPVHHDDYSNYASNVITWGWLWIRPLSTQLIHLLAKIGPEWLIWSVGLLTVCYVLLMWKLLCEIVHPTNQWALLIFFTTSCFSTPIIVEYARYTGMITHLLSGCLGLAATLTLFKEISKPQQGWIYFSIFLMLLSTFAKEDFLIMYAISIVYAAIISQKQRKSILILGFTCLTFCMSIIFGAKFFGSSTFLGVNETSSPYFINISPSSILSTMWKYLSGAGHNSMKRHGQIISFFAIFSTLSCIFLITFRKKLPKNIFFIIATISVMLPYSLLPNHVNAYYEFIWIPLLIGSVLVALIELFTDLSTSYEGYFVKPSTIIFFLLAVTLTIIDYSGRKNIARWYDKAGSTNKKIIQLLIENKEEINSTGNVYILGANAFSPWYMHGGTYLSNVLGLHAKWYISANSSSPLYEGLVIGANSSEGQIVLANKSIRLPTPCLTIDLQGFK